MEVTDGICIDAMYLRCGSNPSRLSRGFFVLVLDHSQRLAFRKAFCTLSHVNAFVCWIKPLDSYRRQDNLLVHCSLNSSKQPCDPDYAENKPITHEIAPNEMVAP